MSDPVFLVFDTETTGLPVRAPKGEPPIPADDPRQPRLCSFSAVIADEFGNEIEAHSFLVKPEGWTMADFDAIAVAEGKTPASQINGLTDDVLNEKGAPVSDVLDFYETQIKSGLITVAFNSIFDTKIMRGELRRAGRPDLFEETPNICVMRNLHPYGQEGLPIVRGFIKLREACDWFGFAHDGAHDALDDARAARMILARLIADGRLPEAKVHYARNPPARPDTAPAPQEAAE